MGDRLFRFRPPHVKRPLAREATNGQILAAMSVLPTFDELARRPDAELDVALGAALVARDAYDDLDVPALLAELASFGEPLAGAGVDRLPLRAQAEAISERFVALGFRGNTEDYYDPRNSLLSDVLARRLGIPITLSLVWCEIARRAGVRARGIAFPGHFLVRVDERHEHHEPIDPCGGTCTPPCTSHHGDSRAPIIVDPFQGGRIVSDEGVSALLRRALGEGAEMHPQLLAAASPRIVLVRLLTNLESTWAKRGEHGRAFVAVDRIVTLVPDSARMLRERAAIALRLGATELARADLLRVVELEPQAPDVPHIEARLAKLTAPPKSALH